jgi:protease-4
MSATVADLFGFERIAETLRRTSAQAEIARLDGLLAVWQPLEK